MYNGLLSQVLEIASSTILLIYPLMGIIHFIKALYKYFMIDDDQLKYKSELFKYILGVILYFLILLIAWNILNIERNMDKYEDLLMIYLFIIPWILAIYYWKINYRFKKLKTNDKTY